MGTGFDGITHQQVREQGNSAAAALYARLGFVRAGRLAGYYADGCAALVLASPVGPRGGPSLRVAQWVARLTGNPVLPEEGDWLGPNMQWIHVTTREEMAREAADAGLELVDWVPDPRIVAVLKRAPEPV